MSKYALQYVTFRLDHKLELMSSEYDDGSSPDRRFIDTRDPLAILECMGSKIGIKTERGLTLRDMLTILKPWYQTLSRIAGFDLNALELPVKTPESKAHDFTHIDVFRTLELPSKTRNGLYIYPVLSPSIQGDAPTYEYGLASFELSETVDLPLVTTDAIFDETGARTEIHTLNDLTFADFLINGLISDLEERHDRTFEQEHVVAPTM